jgi:hypothetical protein
VSGKRVACAEFVGFLTDFVVTKPLGKETRQVDGSLDRHTKLPFAKHDVTARGMFISPNQVCTSFERS